MQRILLATTGILALAGAAQAQNFTPNSTFTDVIQNSPGSGSFTVNLTPGTVALNSTTNLTISIVNAANYNTTGSQWLVFHYAATGQISQPNENWSISQNGLQAAQDINFIADFTQFTDSDGDPFNQTNHIFNQPLISNPVPGGTGNGEGSSGFEAFIAAGPAFPLGAFADPFSIVTNALGATQPFGFTQALEFAPAEFIPPSGVPEPRTWAMLGLGFAAMAFLGVRRKRQARFAI